MNPLLNDSVVRREAELRAEFASAQPFRHIVIEPFLDPAFCDRLRTEFPAFSDEFAVNERGERGRKAVVSALGQLGPAYAEFDRLMQDQPFLDLIGRVTGIPDVLYDPDYVGGGTHENLDGQELDPHVDFNFHPSRWWHRRLNLILFLNPEWRPEWGGCLELLRDPWAGGNDDRRVVVPAANRAVLFETTECSWHGFPRIELPPGSGMSRRSIAVYFYTKTRPIDQTAPSHGTVYYQRPLPERIRAGRTLDEADVEELQVLLARRDRHLRFLYEREIEHSRLFESITRSPSFRIGRALTWPARLLRSLGRKRV